MRKYIAAILVPLFLLLLSYHLVLLFYPQTFEQRQTVSELMNKQPLSLNLTPQERLHMEDVSVLMEGARIALALLFFTLFGLYWIAQRNYDELREMLRWGGWSTISVMGVMLLAQLFSFQWSFIIFHSIFFPQGNWQFAADSMLIQTFPGEFFFGMGVGIFGLTVVLAAVLLFLGRKKKVDHGKTGFSTRG